MGELLQPPYASKIPVLKIGRGNLPKQFWITIFIYLTTLAQLDLNTIMKKLQDTPQSQKKTSWAELGLSSGRYRFDGYSFEIYWISLFVCSKKNLGQKRLGPKKFVRKFFLGPTSSKSKKFGSKKVLGSKKLLVPKILGLKVIWVQKDSG